jgi:plasmid stabilization system protein ParE
MAEYQKRLIVEWTTTAERQFFDILDYWVQRNKSGSYSEKLAEVVWERTSFIAKNPFSFVQTKFPDTRKTSLGHFYIYYKVTQTKVIITAFWDNRQDPKKLYDLLK